MNHAGPNAARVSSRYPAAALVASVAFAVLELAPPWAAGARRAEMYNAIGRLAFHFASQFTPAPSLVRAGSDRTDLAFQLFLGGEALLMALFTVLLWWRVHPGLKRTPLADTLLLAAQLLLAVVLNSLAFHLVVAVQLAALLPLRRALPWLAVQFLLGVGMDGWVLCNPVLRLGDERIRTALALLTTERCLLLLGFAFAYMVRQEQLGRVRLAAANAQLRATQSLLGDTVRSSERMRIARDLHDAVGHHLTALNLHLDLALRQSGAAPPTALATAREAARTLLAEVRGVVSAERQDGGIGLRQALRLLCDGIPSPAIELAMDGRLDDCAPAAAHTLLCCVQEAITNTMRHAGATLLTIHIRRDDDLVLARIIDDGRGGHGAMEGNGLSGMRERLAQHGGALRTGSGAKHGDGDANGPGAGDGNGRAGTAPRGYWLELSLPLTGARA